MMNKIIGLDDFKRVAEEAEEMGKWESWYKNYYLKYKDVFDGHLKNLYMSDITIFKGFIEEMDFKKSIDQAERLINDGLIEEITEIIKRSEGGLSYRSEYDVYLLIGFGHVAGTAFISKRPYLYLGLETLSYIDLEDLVPHEFNHMVRLDSDGDYYKKGIREITFGECMMLEGIGTLYPMIISRKQYKDRDELMKKALMVRDDTYELLKKYESKYLDELLNISDEKMNEEYWGRYFVYNADERIGDKPTKAAYFIGCLIALALLESGIGIEELTRMKSSEIIQMYKNI